MNLAFFDIDYTIYKKGSGPEFYKFVARKGWTEIDVLSKHQQMMEKFEAHEISYQETVELAIQLLADVMVGKSEAQVKEWLRLFFEEMNLVNKWVKPLFEVLKKHHFKIYLVSASGSPLVNGFAELLQADDWFASEFEMINGNYSGKVLHFLHSVQKGEIVEDLKKVSDAKQVWVFGDSEGDSAMLSAADLAFVYEPWDEDFKKQINKKGWKIVDSESILNIANTTLNSP